MALGRFLKGRAGINLNIAYAGHGGAGGAVAVIHGIRSASGDASAC